MLPWVYILIMNIIIVSGMQNGSAQSTRIGEGSILTLERIERHQAGIYQCSADNGVGEPVTLEMKLDILCEY